MRGGPTASTVKVAFSLAFASDPKAPDIGFFTCQQHYPENFWNPAFQLHANGVEGIAGVTIVAENPADHARLPGALLPAPPTGRVDSGGISIKTGRGDIEVLDPAAYRQYFAAQPPDLTRGARLAAIRLLVRDLAVATDALSERWHRGRGASWQS